MCCGSCLRASSAHGRAASPPQRQPPHQCRRTRAIGRTRPRCWRRATLYCSRSWPSWGASRVSRRLVPTSRSRLVWIPCRSQRLSAHGVELDGPSHLVASSHSWKQATLNSHPRVLHICTTQSVRSAPVYIPCTHWTTKYAYRQVIHYAILTSPHNRPFRGERVSSLPTCSKCACCA